MVGSCHSIAVFPPWDMTISLGLRTEQEIVTFYCGDGFQTPAFFTSIIIWL